MLNTTSDCHKTRTAALIKTLIVIIINYLLSHIAEQ